MSDLGAKSDIKIPMSRTDLLAQICAEMTREHIHFTVEQLDAQNWIITILGMAR